MRSRTFSHNSSQSTQPAGPNRGARRLRGTRAALTSYIPGLWTYRNASVLRRSGGLVPGLQPQPYWDLRHSPVAAGRFEPYRDFGHRKPGSRAHGYRDDGHAGTGIGGIEPGRTTGIPGTSSAANSPARLVISPGNSVPFNRDQNSSTRGDAFFESGEGTCRTTA